MVERHCRSHPKRRIDWRLYDVVDKGDYWTLVNLMMVTYGHASVTRRQEGQMKLNIQVCSVTACFWRLEQ